MSAVLEHLHDHHTPLIPASKVEAFAFGDDAKFAEFAHSIVGELVVDASKVSRGRRYSAPIERIPK